MNCIVVADMNWAIGKDNGLLAHLPGDLKYYKEKTLGKVIVIGRVISGRQTASRKNKPCTDGKSGL